MPIALLLFFFFASLVSSDFDIDAGQSGPMSDWATKDLCPRLWICPPTATYEADHCGAVLFAAVRPPGSTLTEEQMSLVQVAIMAMRQHGSHVRYLAGWRYAPQGTRLLSHPVLRLATVI